MNEIKSDIPYQAISCDLHSQYELAIMHKNKLFLTWRNKEGIVTETDISPVDIQIKNKAEYLVAKKHGKTDVFLIRLDHIIEMNVF